MFTPTTRSCPWKSSCRPTIAPTRLFHHRSSVLSISAPCPGKVTTQSYRCSHSRNQDTVTPFEQAQPCLSQLRVWYVNVPACLQMDVNHARRLSSNGYLHLSYYGVKMTLLRRLKRSTALPLRGLEHALAVNLNEPTMDESEPARANYTSDIFEFGVWDLPSDGALDLLGDMLMTPNNFSLGEDAG
jgi:hypothetical protein